MLRFLVIVSILGFWQQVASAQATQPEDDAAKLYLQAAKLLRDNDNLNIVAPAASNLDYTGYPPYPAAWKSMEKADFAANVEARSLAHQAESIDHANWPKRDPAHRNTSYLNDTRNVANELADAAMYQHLQGDDAAAIETLRDEGHLADMVANPADRKLINLLVSIGIQAEVFNRLDIITSAVILTKDPADTKGLQVNVARELIKGMLEHEDAKTELDNVLRAEGTGVTPILKPSIDRILRN